MPSMLIVKIGASGDVVRTTSLLHISGGWDVDWFVGKENRQLLPHSLIRNIITDARQIPEHTTYDRVISLEDDPAIIREIFARIDAREVFGSFVNKKAEMDYTEDSSTWFDMSLISKFGIEKANELKLANRLSYQEILFNSMGHDFRGESYILPSPLPSSDLRGDIAVAPIAGKRWPMKNWFYFNDLISLLSRDFKVNILPERPTILEHAGDISNHSLVISNDSLPMHLALGLGLPAVAFFTCTSPWEIYDYGLLTKLVSPELARYFFKKEYVDDAVKSISLESAYKAVVDTMCFHNAAGSVLVQNRRVA